MTTTKNYGPWIVGEEGVGITDLRQWERSEVAELVIDGENTAP